MAPKLPSPPTPEPARVTSLDDCAPKFAAAVTRVLERLRPAYPHAQCRETIRTNARQGYLFQFGRSYDDGRGIVTNIRTAETDWHYFGLAADLAEFADADQDNTDAFARALQIAAEAEGLTSGRDWAHDAPAPGEIGASTHFVDGPHIQWGPPMRSSPSDRARALFVQGGNAAVWAAVEAV